jgi:hypothetical protein
MTQAMERYDYFACDGGPHLLLPLALASKWKGVENPDDVLDPSTDYGRACAASDAGVALLPIGDGHALVLGASPPMTAWAVAPDAKSIDVYILESWATDDLDALVDEVRNVPVSPFQKHFTWVVPVGGVVLMFAGDTVGGPVYGLKHVPLAEGPHAVESVACELESGAATIVRVTPLH